MLEEVDLVLENSTKKKRRKKPSLKHEAEIYKIYSQRLVKKLEKKMLDLEISEKLYRTIFDNALDAIYLNYLDDRDVPGKFLQVNQIACDLLGYSKEEFSDLMPADLDTQKYRDQNIMVVMELVKEKSVTFRTDHKAKNGDIIPVEISSHLFLLEGKRAVLSVARDIRKRLEKDKELAFAERNWFMTVNSMDEVIMVVDNNRIIQMINNSGAMLLQKRKDEIVGNPCFEVFHDIADPNTSCPFTESIEKGLSKSKEYYYRSKDKYFSCKSTPVYQPGEKNLRYIIVMADITDKKRKEIEINNYREELERLVAERTDNLENKNEELKNYIKIFEHREFRIKELRDEVKRLKAELEKQ